MGEVNFIEWNVERSKKRNMKQTEYSLKKGSDAKAIEIAEEIAYLKSQGKSAEEKERELEKEINVMFFNTRIFNGRAGYHEITKFDK